MEFHQFNNFGALADKMIGQKVKGKVLTRPDIVKKVDSLTALMAPCQVLSSFV